MSPSTGTQNCNVEPFLQFQKFIAPTGPSVVVLVHGNVQNIGSEEEFHLQDEIAGINFSVFDPNVRPGNQNLTTKEIPICNKEIIENVLVIGNMSFLGRNCTSSETNTRKHYRSFD